MPVQEKKYELTFKNLRHREIPCLVIAVPQKNATSLQYEKHSNSGSGNCQDRTRTKVLKSLKQKLVRIPTKHNKKSKSLSCLHRKREANSEVVKKRVYRRKSLQVETSPIQKPPLTSPKKAVDDILNTTSDVSKTSPIQKPPPTSPKKAVDDILNTTSDVSKTSPVTSEKTKTKRTYRKKVYAGATITPILDSPVATSTTQSCFGAPVITPETPKKRVYRKRLKIPAVPHNTPVFCQTSDGDTSTSASFLGHSEIITVGKRRRGRPCLSLPPVLVSENSSESTISQGSDKGSTSRRARRHRWAFDSDGEDEDEEQVSEYELLRQKNIEENLKMLRELFDKQGLQFGEKTSETPKKKKTYTKLPLPPPRPRSQRIEIRRTYNPLDFSELDEKISMSETAFV